jgi:hypothetical protein
MHVSKGSSVQQLAMGGFQQPVERTPVPHPLLEFAWEHA